MQSNDRQIEALAEKLKETSSVKARISILNETPEVQQFLQAEHPLCSMLPGLDMDSESVLKQVIALGQAPLFSEKISQENVAILLNHLCDVDDFYRELGGLAGYQIHVRRLLEKNSDAREGAAFHSPSFVDISNWSDEVEKAVEAGIAAMPYLCEMYPLGGAADRLHLIDETTGHELPAAKLKFAGKTLLERLLADLESRELLYYQRTGRMLNTPVAIMTSHEKNNWIHIQEILQENSWFGRPKETFRLFVQPLVPVVDELGNWLWNDPWKLLMKPGGHGAIWKLAKDNGIFDWFKSFGSKFALIRQINNPLAGLDYGLLAFTGYGYSKKMSFGFASCPRICQAAEGVNVLVERKDKQGYLYNLSNIEYCDFAKYGVEDAPMRSGEPFSRFTSNTNILFGQLDALEEAVGRCPFPGLLMNLKKDAKGNSAGRLESTMQNIADVFIEAQENQLRDQLLNTTFITYNDRNKTISTAKKAYVPGNSMNETPEKCFYDFMSAAADLLKKHCHYDLPPERSLEAMVEAHPSFVFLFHPSLGPLFQTIGKKIRSGRLADGSEMQLEIADVDFESLDLDGSLQVKTKLTRELLMKRLSKCSLKNCKIENAGVDWADSKPFWKGSYKRNETLLIELGVDAEFVAENVHFRGGAHFVVQNGEKMCVKQVGDSLRIEKKPR